MPNNGIDFKAWSAVLNTYKMFDCLASLVISRNNLASFYNKKKVGFILFSSVYITDVLPVWLHLISDCCLCPQVIYILLNICIKLDVTCIWIIQFFFITQPLLTSSFLIYFESLTAHSCLRLVSVCFNAFCYFQINNLVGYNCKPLTLFC